MVMLQLKHSDINMEQGSTVLDEREKAKIGSWLLWRKCVH